MGIPWKKLAAWAIEQAAKWGVGTLTKETPAKKKPKPPKG